jgi:hypothetical protein
VSWWDARTLFSSLHSLRVNPTSDTWRCCDNLLTQERCRMRFPAHSEQDKSPLLERAGSRNTKETNELATMPKSPPHLSSFTCPSLIPRATHIHLPNSLRKRPSIPSAPPHLARAALIKAPHGCKLPFNRAGLHLRFLDEG